MTVVEGVKISETQKQLQGIKISDFLLRPTK
jgi:hypothetical protein